MAFRLVKHAFFMIFRNFGTALRVSVFPSFLVFGFMLLFGILMSGIVSPAAGVAGISLIMLPIFIAVILFWTGWVAVSWHRFILLEEPVGILPAFSGRPIWPYAGRVFLYGLVIAAIALPAGWVINAIALSTSMVVTQIASLVLSICLTVVWMRWAITLPAVAIGQHAYMFEGWGKTDRFNGTIFGVAFILLGLNFLVSILVAALFFPMLATSVAFASLFQIVILAVQWLTFMMGLSILTTLYGHIYEGRALAD